MLNADVAPMWDSRLYNAGFVVVKPTNISKRLYRMMKVITDKSPSTPDQSALNTVVKILKNEDAGLNLKTLNTRRFPNGKDYFETQGHFFAPIDGQKCNKQEKSNCAVVVHHNWIITKAAKVYRFREHLMWMYDGDDKYYSCNTRRYLMYDDRSPILLQDQQSKVQQAVKSKSEISELKTALTIGYLLNRTVVLPAFHSGKMNTMVPLHYVLHVRSFEAHFGGKYRENSFLRHPKVPLDVKKSGTSADSQKQIIDQSNNSTLSDLNVVVSAVDVVRKFSKVNDRVLRFGSLYGITVVLGNSSEDAAFKQKLNQAFYRSHHRQYKPAGRW